MTMTMIELPSARVLLDRARERSLAPLIDELAGTSAPRSARAALCRALREDLSQCVEYPERLVQLLYKKLAHHGAGEGSARALDPDERARLGAWLEELVREAKLELWLRSLRTRDLPANDALVQEFIGDFDRYGVELAFVGDGSVVAISSARGVCAWSCTNGARLGSIAMPAPHAWRIDMTRTREREAEGEGSTFIVDRRTNEVKLSIPALDFGQWMVTRALPSLDAAIVAGWVDDYEGIVARYDRSLLGASERWSVRLDGSIYTMALSADGTLLAVATGARVVLLDPRDGAALGSLSLSQEVDAVALSFDNERLATATSTAIRVWDLRAIRRGHSREPADTSALVGRVDAQFDARSERALLGGALCDARTGELVAALPLDSGRYLEGGPPEGAAGIFGDRVIEVGFGVRVFSLKNGDRISTAKLGPFAHWHFVRIAPDGRKLAWARRDSLTRWKLCSIDTGEVEREFVSDESPAESFAFAPDGRTLASAHRDGAVRLWDLSCESPSRVVLVGGELYGAAWSIDSARLVVAVRGVGLAQIDVASGAVVARCDFAMPGPFDERELLRDSAGRVSWQATDGAIAALHGWSGFRARAHRWSVLRDVAGWNICDERTGARAFIASATRPVIDPTGRLVATREELYAIEPSRDER